jgi:hypothetical protein
MIPILKVQAEGAFAYDGYADQTDTPLIMADGWRMNLTKEQVEGEDPRLIQRAIVAAMLIHMGARVGIKLVLANNQDDTTPTEVPMDVERDVMALINKVKKS